MLISEEMKKKNISILEFYNVNHNKTFVGIMSKKFPKEILTCIIDFAGVRFTTYSGIDSGISNIR